MNQQEKYSVGAIILAAGQSKRMGRNKMLLPFERSTVIAAIVVLRHRENIDRLRHGTERRIGERVAPR